MQNMDVNERIRFSINRCVGGPAWGEQGDIGGTRAFASEAEFLLFRVFRGYFLSKCSTHPQHQ